MKKYICVLMALLCLSIVSCTQYCHTYDQVATTRDRNICGHLKDTVILYAVFVDVHEYHLFSEFDVRSTMDSVKKATEWIECQAEENGSDLIIKPVLHGERKKWSFREGRARMVRARLHPFIKYGRKKKYAQYLNSWTDYICRYVGRTFKRKKSNRVEKRRKIQNAQDLLAELRNKYSTSNVALMIFVNGYYENDPSMSLNTYIDGPQVEYSIITKKNPGDIAHEFLHLFGGVDLYPTQYHSNFNFTDIAAKYPNEIMRVSHKDLSKMTISPITKYYIGWRDDIPHDDLRMLYHHANVLTY